MKKVVAILTLGLYFSLSVVQAINIHFCHGELESLYFTSEKTSCCSTDHIDHSTCCKDITIEVDFDADHLVSESRSIQDSEDAFHILYGLFNHVHADVEHDYQSAVYPADKKPPPKLYLIQQSFLFYG